MAARGSGIGTALGDLAGALLPLSVRDLQRELEERLRKAPTRLNEFGFDPYGLSPAVVAARAAAARAALPVLLPRRDPRHRARSAGPRAAWSPTTPASCRSTARCSASRCCSRPIRRASRARMGEYWIPNLPWVSIAAARVGALVGTPSNCAHMLENGECVTVFPEGVRGMNKLYSQRYRLQRFGMGFMRLALETAHADRAGRDRRLRGAAAGLREPGPASAGCSACRRSRSRPTFPWLGPLGLLPLPVKYRIHFGEPLHFEGDPTDEDGVIEEKVDRVKAAITALLEQGRRERRGVFR